MFKEQENWYKDMETQAVEGFAKPDFTQYKTLHPEATLPFV